MVVDTSVSIFRVGYSIFNIHPHPTGPDLPLDGLLLDFCNKISSGKVIRPDGYGRRLKPKPSPPLSRQPRQRRFGLIPQMLMPLGRHVVHLQEL